MWAQFLWLLQRLQQRQRLQLRLQMVGRHRRSHSVLPRSRMYLKLPMKQHLQLPQPDARVSHFATDDTK